MNDLHEIEPPLTLQTPQNGSNRRKRPTNNSKKNTEESGQMSIQLPTELIKRIKLTAMVNNQSASEVIEIYLTAGKKLPRYTITEE